MGSILSGRRNGKPLVENCLTIDLARIMRLAPIGLGQSGHGQLHWSIEGQQLAAIRFRLDLRELENARMILYFFAAQPNGERAPRKQTITLVTTPQHLGGKRWWLRCPMTGKRVRTLHLPPDRSRFASREALGLAYRVERLDHFDRPFEKLFRVQRRLGQPQAFGAGLERPKGMWRRTFARHAERLMTAELACMNGIAALIERA
ncbi:MAG: hypothetical protein P4N59_14605 [Negativicutes bacterium]|nr:hypothetical protein [Negativicutes bacterium]